MALKNGEEYITSLRSLRLQAHVMGKREEVLPDHPLIAPSVRAVATTFDCAHHEETRDLFRARSSLTGEEVNRFTHLHQSPEDLIKKVMMQRYCGNLTASCFQRCVGLDAANAVFSVTYECDEKHGTDYHQRFRKYWSWVQREDLVVDGAMTDPKGDRGRRPKDQSDPDLFLRVVERRRDGVVVRGAKLHQTGMVNSHEMIVMPTTHLLPEEKDWAISFAVPTHSKGITYLYG